MKKDAAYYESAYNPRLVVPEIASHFERWRTLAPVRWTDVTYDSSRGRSPASSSALSGRTLRRRCRLRAETRSPGGESSSRNMTSVSERRGCRNAGDVILARL